MAYTDTTRKAEAQGGAVGSLNVTLNSTVAGNLVVCGTSSFESVGATMSPTVTDGGNTWTKHSTVQGGTSNKQAASVSFSVLGTGGNRTINSDPGTSTYDMSIYVHEFGGPHATPASGTPATASGVGAVTADTGSTTPADANCLIIAVLGCTSSGTITENVSPGDTGFTLSNDHESGTNAEPGSMVFKIVSGGPGANRHAWTIPSGDWTALIAGLKPSVAKMPAPVVVLQASKRASYY